MPRQEGDVVDVAQVDEATAVEGLSQGSRRCRPLIRGYCHPRLSSLG
jgi:hypothetical protein